MLKRFLDFLIFSNIYVAAPLTFLSYQTLVFFPIAKDKIAVFPFVYCASLFLYTFHRLLGVNLNRGANETERHRWARQHKRLLQVILVLSGLGWIIYLSQIFQPFIVALVPAGIIAFAYSYPVIPGKERALRLRDIPFMKVFLIAVVVAYITVMLPLLMENEFDHEVHPGVLLSFLERACFIFAITIPFDIRDYHLDLQAGLKTIPNQWGVQRSKWLAVIAIMLFLTLAFLQVYWTGTMSARYLPAFLGSALASMLVIRSSQPGGSEYYYSLLVEGMMILQTVFILFAHYCI